MLRIDFFDKFFKSKKNTIEKIVKYNSNDKYNLTDELYFRIQEVDQKISENSSALIEAQIVKLRSNLPQSNNLIKKIGKNIYKKKLEDSIYWHQIQIKELYAERRKLQINLEKTQGVFWINRIKRFLQIIVIGIFILLAILIFFSGFILIIYLLPLIILILLGYWILSKKY